MSESGEVIIENLEDKLDSFSLDHEAETPPNCKAKTFSVGDGNIIGKMLFKNSLIVRHPCLLIKDLSFLRQIVMQMLLLCLLRKKKVCASSSCLAKDVL